MGCSSGVRACELQINCPPQPEPSVLWQRWGRRGAIQGTYFLGRKLPVKPQFSVQGVLMFHVCLGNGTGRHEVPETESGYREQKKKQSCDGKVWRSNTVPLSFS